MDRVVLAVGIEGRDIVTDLRFVEDAGEIEPARLPVADRLVLVEQSVWPIISSKVRKPISAIRFTHFLGDEEEVVDHVFRLAGELAAQFRVLGRDAHGAGVESGTCAS